LSSAAANKIDWSRPFGGVAMMSKPRIDEEQYGRGSCGR
jgi:hypothetical protein